MAETAIWRRLRRRVRPYAAELAGVASAAATFLFLEAHGLRFGWQALAHTAGALNRLALWLLALGLGLQVVARFVRREGAAGYLRSLAHLEWWIGWLRLWLVVVLLVYGYTWLKVSIPLVRVVLFDQGLWRLDRLLHFGLAPTTLAVELTAGTVLPELLDIWYSLWVLSIPLGFAYVLANPRHAVRKNFVIANVVLWTAGAWFYMAVPSLGPCYASPEIFDPVRNEMPRTEATQRFVWEHY